MKKLTVNQKKVTHKVTNKTVVSGTSGSTYKVSQKKNGRAQCTCRWGDFHPNMVKADSCSHVRAVLNW